MFEDGKTALYPSEMLYAALPSLKNVIDGPGPEELEEVLGSLTRLTNLKPTRNPSIYLFSTRPKHRQLLVFLPQSRCPEMAGFFYRTVFVSETEPAESLEAESISQNSTTTARQLSRFGSGFLSYHSDVARSSATQRSISVS